MEIKISFQQLKFVKKKELVLQGRKIIESYFIKKILGILATFRF